MSAYIIAEVTVTKPAQYEDYKRLSTLARGAAHGQRTGLGGGRAQSVQAVVTRGGKKLCYLQKPGDQLEACEVQIGSFNDNFIEIAQGVKLGDKVLLTPPRLIEAEPATKTRKTEKSKAKNGKTATKS